MLESTRAPHLGSVRALGKGTLKRQSFGENASTEQSTGLGQRLFSRKCKSEGLQARLFSLESGSQGTRWGYQGEEVDEMAVSHKQPRSKPQLRSLAAQKTKE